MGYLYLFAISKKSAEYLNIKKKTFAFNKTVTVQPTYSTTPAKYYKQERNQFFNVVPKNIYRCEIYSRWQCIPNSYYSVYEKLV